MKMTIQYSVLFAFNKGERERGFWISSLRFATVESIPCFTFLPVVGLCQFSSNIKIGKLHFQRRAICSHLSNLFFSFSFFSF